jgi:hypothetical protein
VGPDQFQSSGDAAKVVQVVSDITGMPPDSITVSYTPVPAGASGGVDGSTGRKLLQQVWLLA